MIDNYPFAEVELTWQIDLFRNPSKMKKEEFMNLIRFCYLNIMRKRHIERNEPEKNLKKKSLKKKWMPKPQN